MGTFPNGLARPPGTPAPPAWGREGQLGPVLLGDAGETDDAAGRCGADPLRAEVVSLLRW